MSDDGYSDSLEEPSMEVHVKTLLGTVFDIKVFPSDTVVDIKKAICRVEGIPIYQQNLIYRSQELKDTTRLCDLGVTAGSTFTLVSSMRGGPISTRRFSLMSCEHYFLKELKDLLEHTREGMLPGSKVSVLVFKEGDIINLLRVIENEDGSYSPYSDGPVVSPPAKPSRKETVEVFQRLAEDTEMCTKIAALRKKMEELNVKKQTRNVGEKEPSGATKKKSNFSYRLLEECSAEGLLCTPDLTVFEKNLDEGNQSESEEIALKDKHRTKPKGLQSVPVPKSNPKSLYNSRKGTYSCTRQNYAKIAKRREPRLFEKAEKNPEGYTSYSRDRTLDAPFDLKNPFESALPSLNGGPQPPKESLDSRLSSEPLDSDRGSTNPYLLGGLSSNNLSDLRILDTDDFLTEDPESILGPQIGDRPSTFLPLHRDGGGANSRLLPVDLTSRLSQSGTFGPLMPPPNKGGGYSLPTLGGEQGAVFSNLEYSLSGGAKEAALRGPGSRGESPVLGATGAAPALEEIGAASKLAELQLLDNEPDLYRTRSQRLHLTRLVLSSEGAERPKSSPDGIELEEHHRRDLWEIHEPAAERLKHSAATCKVGLLKRRQNVEYTSNYEEGPGGGDLKPELRGNLGGGGGDFASNASGEIGGGGVCSGSTNYFVPHAQYLSAPSAIPPQYAPKHHSKYCDLFFSRSNAEPPRSPLYSRRNRKENLEISEETSTKCPKTGVNLEADCSSIQRLTNDDILGLRDEFSAEDLFGYYNLGCAADLLEKVEENNNSTKSKESIKLPPVIKKKSRCNECNKRLNITNIYNCRCGRIFCSQHRYSEVHRCTYDYKTEGRKILERQNPLVTADKIQRF
ncbi:uncharacterized protein LOC126746683 [Anthonomus grandis grandis]|uniref:uncharacterized protein LOC126746683 n=1 Tax=Anthonomus grandis grandis TaxID=2921223 RepID=UPI00216573B3|nr:uncharacterized protein LOC126746683 [Anthonomus grandis grandis]